MYPGTQMICPYDDYADHNSLCPISKSRHCDWPAIGSRANSTEIKQNRNKTGPQSRVIVLCLFYAAIYPFLILIFSEAPFYLGKPRLLCLCYSSQLSGLCLLFSLFIVIFAETPALYADTG